MNDARFCRLVKQCVEELELDLSGLNVATASGSNGYLATPLLAACAGANVFALAVDSSYASAETLRSESARLRERLQPRGALTWLSSREEVPNGIDLFTNLGALRPLDASILVKGSKHAAVSYMCEAWEWREGDVDGAFCRTQGIPIAGHDEDFRGDDVFTSTGQLALRLCMEAGLSVRNDVILVLGKDRFADIITQALSANGAHAHTVREARDLTQTMVANADAILTCDYANPMPVLGGRAGPTPAELAEWNPALTLVQFAGAIPFDELLQAGLHLYPHEPLPPIRMARTLAYLGLRPILRLMAQGLKVGELLVKQRMGHKISERYQSLLQPIS